ncbi:hypothetical protein ACWWAE_06245 [Xylella fastidiosa subsp. multiplex]|uniref:hypothetical protein n=1 Tax=Xylella fastidiosa TaxID=2371 RepID=UPI0035D478CC
MSKQSLKEKEEKDWLRAVACHRKLAEFGFVESYPVDPSERLKEVRFSSKNLIFIIVIDLLMCEQSWQTLDADTGNFLPSPILALCYFLPDIENLIARYDAAGENIEQIFEVKLNLYRENPWVIQSKAWAFNEEFLEAIKKTDEWVNKEMHGKTVPLKPWEYERRLHSYRNPNTQIPQIPIDPR